jgi:hypothetical protein
VRVIDEIEARHAATSPGPWRYGPRDFAPRIVYPASGYSLPAHSYSMNPADAEFIAHSWQDVRTLLDEVARLTIALQALEIGT